jgi:hypothetical protein
VLGGRGAMPGGEHRSWGHVVVGASERAAGRRLLLACEASVCLASRAVSPASSSCSLCVGCLFGMVTCACCPTAQAVHCDLRSMCCVPLDSTGTTRRPQATASGGWGPLLMTRAAAGRLCLGSATLRIHHQLLYVHMARARCGPWRLSSSSTQECPA